MKKLIPFIIVLIAIAGTSFSYLNSESSKSDLYVLVKYKAQPGKAVMAIEKLEGLITEVEKEPNYRNVTMLVDPADSTNILLYEQWQDEGYYKNEHMQTAHLKQFINDSRNFLAGPPDISFWKKAKE